MDKRMTNSLDYLDSVETCHAYIRELQQRIEHLEIEVKLNLLRGDRPYKVLGFHCARGLSRDDGFGVYANFCCCPWRWPTAGSRSMTRSATRWQRLRMAC
jgi:hypothetical protein